VILAVVLWAFDQYATTHRWHLDSMVADATKARLWTSGRVLGAWVDGGLMVWLFGYGNSGSFSRLVHGFYPEVMPVEILCEEGLVGLALWGAIIGISLAQIPRVYRLVRPYEYERGLFAALAAIFVFELVQTFKGGSLLTNTSSFIFAILLSRYCAYLTREIQAVEEDRLLQPAAEEQQLVPAYGYWSGGARA
jgi:hypothetical protein